MTPKENVEAGQAKIGEESSLAEGSSLAETDGGEAKQIQEESAEFLHKILSLFCYISFISQNLNLIHTLQRPDSKSFL